MRLHVFAAVVAGSTAIASEEALLLHLRAPPGVVTVPSSTQANVTTYMYIPVADPTALCLDGSQYGFAFCPASQPDAPWNVTMQGGGWCYNEAECLQRAGTNLGSNATLPQEATTFLCDPATNPTNAAKLFYCDGASFAGFRQDPWPVPGSNASLWFRGTRNLDAALDTLLAMGMNNATRIVLAGGSAGGLAAFLHLDHVAQRLATQAPHARVVGQPLCGFFLDHGNDGNAPENVTYPLQMQYVYTMQNVSGSLSQECQNALAPDSWKCIMAPHAAAFINTPWFATQSRFDHWQLVYEAFLPCIAAQPYGPPYLPSSCNATQDADIQAYGYEFMEQFSPLMTSNSKNGAFVDACIIHGSTNSTIDGLTNFEAFEAWYAGNSQQWWIMKCGTGANATSAGPCDTSPVCAPFP
jgi:hypothetical protein